MARKPKSEKAGNGAAETTSQKLSRLAGARVPAALRKIELVGNLASYKPTDQQQATIMRVFEDAVKRLRIKLSGAKSASSFELGGGE